MKPVHRFLLVSFILAFAALLGLFAQDVLSSLIAPNLVAKLIRQLRDDDPNVRDEAATALVSRPDLANELEPYMEENNPDLRKRIGEILDGIRVERDRLTWNRLPNRIETHQFDTVIEEFLAMRARVREAEWQRLIAELKVAFDSIVKTAKINRVGFPRMLLRRPFHERLLHPNGDFVEPESVDLNDLRVLESSISNRGWISGAMLINSGAVSTKYAILNSVVLSNDSIIAEGITGSLLIVDGNISCGDVGFGTVLIASGEINIAETRPSSYAVILPGSKLPPGTVQFFNPASLGIEVTNREDRVRIETLKTDTIFGRSKLAVGDVLTTVNDKPVKSVAEFRRMIRTLVARQERAVFAGKRGTDDFKATISFIGQALP